MTSEQEVAASLARIEAQGRATHHRMDEYRADLIRHIDHDDERFDTMNERITKGRVKQGWLIGAGVGGLWVVTWLKDHLTF